MTKFLEKYSVIDNKKAILRKISDLTPEEKNRNKLLNAIDDQLKYIDELSNGHDITLTHNDKSQKPRLFWQDTLGGFLFTPRFGNDFLFGKDRGISCSSYAELSVAQSRIKNNKFGIYLFKTVCLLPSDLLTFVRL